jgi:energy-coupling factor transporter ATP-binding protein EcfA2
VLRADDVPLDVVREVGQSVMATVSEKRSTWTRWNLHAEASRQLMGWRFASMLDREAITGLVVDAAEQASLRSPRPSSRPARSVPPPRRHLTVPSHASTLFSSEALLAAEDRLLARADTLAGPVRCWRRWNGSPASPDTRGRMLGEDQAAALAAIAVSGRTLDVLVGPAGAGKTTAMNALRRAWEKEHGAGSVVGLAPLRGRGAGARRRSGDRDGEHGEVVAEPPHARHHVRGGQLVIIDEASLAGTASLDRITAEAEKAGAKALLVGDWGQLQSVDAGGAFGLLVHARDDAPELRHLHRFTHAWEKTTSLQLRHGRPRRSTRSSSHDRITGGEAEKP